MAPQVVAKLLAQHFAVRNFGVCVCVCAALGSLGHRLAQLGWAFATLPDSMSSSAAKEAGRERASVALWVV
eukprot:6397175-Alexandrium_andersonii.AAC.1